MCRAVSPASTPLTMARATPSPATRVVLKMPVAMPARSLGTTLTARPSISPQGRLMPTPIISIGPTKAWGSPAAIATASHARPPADTSRPAPQMTAGASQRVIRPAATGSNSNGADSAIISRPAAISLRPSTAMKRTGSRISSTTKA
ncbi:hypothetical protein LMG3481_01688 [Achromobacter deleyi]|nr:hypothetical protein LMG3481_01688 [Achromobacter deleyi]CAB3850621.1 hypothetical protein LMG3412_01731 [Achromobacter deleyi]